MIRRILRETVEEHIHHETSFDFSSEKARSSSPISILSVSPEPPQKSPPKVIKVLPKPERFALALEVLNTNISLNQAAKSFGVSRSTPVRHSKGCRSKTEYAESRRRLNEVEEKALCKFIDDYTALGFPPRFHMIEQKAMLLIRLREPDSSPLGKNWLRRFLDRHPDYRGKFPRHLDQECHWNSNKDVFKAWFRLYHDTCQKYEISEDNQYNMDEKGYMMAGHVKYV